MTHTRVDSRYNENFMDETRGESKNNIVYVRVGIRRKARSIDVE